MVRDNGERQGLRLPVAHHRSDDGDEVRRQGRHRQRAQQPVQALRAVQAARTTRTTRSRSARTAPRRWRPRPRWRGTSRPSARRASAARATRRRWTSRRSSTRRSPTPGTRDGVLEVRVPAPRQGRLADDLQDQVQHGRPPLLPRAVGRVRPRVRRGRRRRTRRRPEAAERRVRRGALLPEHLPRDSTRRAPTRRAAATCPASATTSSEDSDDKYRPKEMTDAQKAMVAVLQPVRLLHPARTRTTPTGQKQLVEVKYARCRLYFEAQHWEEAARLLQGDRVRPLGQRLGVYAAQLYLESINVLTFHGTPNRERRASTT